MRSGSNIVVTGGAGFIGSHICKALKKRGFVPVSYDNLSRGNATAVKFGPFEQGDILDPDRFHSVLEKYRPLAVIHLAAFAYIAESIEKPEMYRTNNVLGTSTLLQAILKYGPIPVVFSSSCATYGEPERLPITEDHPQRPINPYGETKLAAERMLADAGRSHRLPWLALRYFNAAGADPEGEIGEVHNPETHIIPLVLKAARDRGSIRIFGSDYKTPDGTCVRDYIHVVDVANAHLRALDYLVAGGESIAINLANSRGYSIKEVIAVAERVCGRAIHAEMMPRRGGDPSILIGDASRARSLLAWAPVRSDLKTQIADAWAWFKR